MLTCMMTCPPGNAVHVTTSEAQPFASQQVTPGVVGVAVPIAALPAVNVTWACVHVLHGFTVVVVVVVVVVVLVDEEVEAKVVVVLAVVAADVVACVDCADEKTYVKQRCTGSKSAEQRWGDHKHEKHPSHNNNPLKTRNDSLVTTGFATVLEGTHGPLSRNNIPNMMAIVKRNVGRGL